LQSSLKLIAPHPVFFPLSFWYHPDIRRLMHVKTPIAAFCLLLVFLATPPAWPDDSARPLRLKTSPGMTVTDMGGWKTVFKGTEFRKMILERAEPYQSIHLKLVRFDSRWIDPRVVHSAAYRLKSANVRTLAERSGAIAMINANYFDDRGMPLGYFKSGGESNANVSKSPLFTAIFAIKDRLAFIVHRDQFTPEQADEGLQAGPLLLVKGSPLIVTRGADKQFRRSVIGIDAARRFVIAVTDNLFGGLTWVELQELFGAPEWRIQTSDLMNLDGGGSTQLHVKTSQFDEYVPGTAEIPLAIGFFPKSQQP
jgi:hypothetical protein